MKARGRKQKVFASISEQYFHIIGFSPENLGKNTVLELLKRYTIFNFFDFEILKNFDGKNKRKMALTYSYFP